MISRLPHYPPTSMIAATLRVLALRCFRVKLGRGGHAEKIASNFSWLLVDQVGRLGLSLVVGVWVARYLGPENFGRLNYAAAFVAIFAAIVPLGLDALVVRELVRQPGEQRRLLSTSVALRALAALLCLLPILAFSYFLPNPDHTVQVLVFITAAGILFQPLESLSLFFQARTEMRYIVVPRSLMLLIVSGLKVGLILQGCSVVWFAVVTLAEAGLVSLTSFLVYRYQLSAPIRFQADWTIARRLLGESWPLLLSGLSIMLYLKIGQLMLGMMLGQQALGVYSAAIRISEFWYFIPGILASSVLPALVKSRELAPDQYRTRLEFYFKVNAAMSYLLAITVSLCSGAIIGALYGRTYSGAGPVLATHVWVLPFVFLGVARGQHLINEGLLRFSMFATLAGLVTNVAANFALIPRYGPVGAAIAVLISYAVSGYVSSFFYSKTFNIGVLQTKALLWPMPAFRTIFAKAD